MEKERGEDKGKKRIQIEFESGEERRRKKRIKGKRKERKLK